MRRFYIQTLVILWILFINWNITSPFELLRFIFENTEHLLIFIFDKTFLLHNLIKEPLSFFYFLLGYFYDTIWIQLAWIRIFKKSCDYSRQLFISLLLVEYTSFPCLFMLRIFYILIYASFLDNLAWFFIKYDLEFMVCLL